MQLQAIRVGLGLSHAQLAAQCGLSEERLKVLESDADHFLRFEIDLLRNFFGRKFQEVRRQENLTQEALADRVQLPLSEVQGWEAAVATA